MCFYVLSSTCVMYENIDTWSQYGLCYDIRTCVLYVLWIIDEQVICESIGNDMVWSMNVLKALIQVICTCYVLKEQVMSYIKLIAWDLKREGNWPAARVLTINAWDKDRTVDHVVMDHLWDSRHPLHIWERWDSGPCGYGPPLGFPLPLLATIVRTVDHVVMDHH